MASVAQIQEEYDAKASQLAGLFAGVGDDLDKMSEDNAKQVKPRNDELAEIGKRLDEARALEKIRKDTMAHLKGREGGGNKPPLDPDAETKGRPKTKSIREILDESVEYKAFRSANRGTATFEFPNPLSDAETKTLVQLSSYPSTGLVDRSLGLVPMALEERTVGDLMLQGTTSMPSLAYMEETTFTNAAAEVDEGGLKPESALAYTERAETVRKIATWIPTTKELMDDVPALRSIIENRLIFMVKRREEQQLLTGDGTAPNISGIMDRAIQTQAKGADNTLDAVYKAMTKIRTGVGSIGSEPTAIVFHPNDWQDIRLLTSNGIYLFGPPSDAGVERLWGKEVRQTTGMTENTALVGAFRPDAQIFRREGITVTISTEHSDYFVYNKIAILAEERLALAIYRPKAFCSVTGI